MINFKFLFFAICLFLMIRSSSADDEPAVNVLDHCKKICYKNFGMESGQCSEFDKCDNCLVDCDEMFGPFLLDVVSKRSEGLLFSINIKWDEIIMKEYKQCLVTWEISGGGLMGNLITDSPKVELTLWADKLYNIQVTCKNTEANTVRSSYTLVVNTKPVTNFSPGKLSSVFLNANGNQEDDVSPKNFVSNVTDNVIGQKSKNETDESNVMKEELIPNKVLIYLICLAVTCSFILLIIAFIITLLSMNSDKCDEKPIEIMRFIAIESLERNAFKYDD